MTVAAACGDDGSESDPDGGTSLDGGPTDGAGRGGRGGSGAGGTAGSTAGRGGVGGDDAGGDAGDGGAQDSGSDAGDSGGDGGDDGGDTDGGADDDASTSGDGSAQIASVRAAAAGGGLDLPVTGVYVTYVRPATGSEGAGFFVQAEASGPAIFVAIDPATLTPALQVGDLIDFTVTELGVENELKQVTAISGLTRMSSGHAIDPLITDVSAATDLVSALDTYESRVIRVSGVLGVFAVAGAAHVASPIATTGLVDADLRLRIPESVRAHYDLVATCSVRVDYGVMWRLNAIAQPSVYTAADLDSITCPAPTVVSAAALDATHVRVLFDRPIAGASADAGDFTFDNGLTASAAAVDGEAVTVTTSAMALGTTYTVTVSSSVTDVLGAAVGSPNSAMFEFEQTAVLAFNEINPNITSLRDLIELVVLSSGTTGGTTIVQRGTAVETLATLPDVIVAAGDFIVVHLSPVGAVGAAPGSETTSKLQYTNASFTANYDAAWDFHGENLGLTFSHRVLELRAAAGTVQDAVPFVLSNVVTPPAAFPSTLQALQAAGGWLPADCGGQPCTYVSVPTAVQISVDYLGCGNSATGNSVQRKPGAFTEMNSDWNAAAAPSWGVANP